MGEQRNEGLQNLAIVCTVGMVMSFFIGNAGASIFFLASSIIMWLEYFYISK